ncbi:phosphoribosylformylglycinamidine cyclo-ligase [Serinibacter salmoneus]|uniref:Phosphoribosylformylglycinamidine cyclo-ligase n=1 Tax=Serinibacter salmoneus TaxID=556530 RepID=A0A2A9CWK6_9MICO|nr:phosphoribosylformylglycinamidine cyclo-ligase [Serinibacter salmoneus]PFG18817.1 phosphoribosylformylglycinamidine cyclo-ligase [Serinibacter salmoneus]
MSDLYSQAGVDVEAGDRAVELMKAAVGRTQGAEVLGGVGGFAGLWDASALRDYTRPLLATSTDGVGTKVALAQRLDIHDTIGIDLVGMVVDDIVVSGAKPLFMTDYIACGRLVPERIAAIVSGIARGCELTRTALVGGETAEHPGLLGPEEYDVAGAATGVVEAADVLGPDRVREGDVLLAMASSGLHSNGYSLVRHVLAGTGWELEAHVADLGRTLGEELLEPTRLYTAACLDLAASHEVHAYTHVTGGGLASNLARVLPAGLVAHVDRSSWQVPPIYSLLARGADSDLVALEGTLNLGVGMIAIVPPESVAGATAQLTRAGIPTWELGRVGVETPDDVTHHTLVTGTKGVRGGAVAMGGSYRTT